MGIATSLTYDVGEGVRAPRRLEWRDARRESVGVAVGLRGCRPAAFGGESGIDRALGRGDRRFGSRGVLRPAPGAFVHREPEGGQLGVQPGSIPASAGLVPRRREGTGDGGVGPDRPERVRMH